MNTGARCKSWHMEISLVSVRNKTFCWSKPLECEDVFFSYQCNTNKPIGHITDRWGEDISLLVTKNSRYWPVLQIPQIQNQLSIHWTCRGIQWMASRHELDLALSCWHIWTGPLRVFWLVLRHWWPILWVLWIARLAIRGSDLFWYVPGMFNLIRI